MSETLSFDAMIQKVPDGFFREALSKSIKKPLSPPAQSRLFLLCLHHTSRKFGHHGINFQYSHLKEEYQNFGQKLGVKKFENNEDYLRLIQPVYEALYGVSLEDSEEIENLEPLKPKELQGVILDFVHFGYNFSSWKRTPRPFLDHLSKYAERYSEKVTIQLTGGDANQHLMEVPSLIEALSKYLSIYQKAAKKEHYQEPPKLFVEALEAASFDINLVANEDAAEIFKLQHNLLTSVCDDQLNIEQRHALLATYGQDILVETEKFISVLNENNFSLNVHSSVGAMTLPSEKLRKGSYYLRTFTQVPEAQAVETAVEREFSARIENIYGIKNSIRVMDVPLEQAKTLNYQKQWFTIQVEPSLISQLQAKLRYVFNVTGVEKGTQGVDPQTLKIISFEAQ